MDDGSPTVSYRIRFDESGPSGAARPSHYLRLAQDAAWIHSERLGFTRAWYAAREVGWLVRAVALEIHDPARHGEIVEVTTRVMGYRRIWARRRTEVARPGARIATLITDWILTDAQGRPARIPAEIPARLPGTEQPIEPLRIPEPPVRPPDVEAESSIRTSELDPLAHVNNAAYLDRMLDLLGAGPVAPAGLIDRPLVGIEYLAAAGAGDRVQEEGWWLDGGQGFAYRLSVPSRGPILRASVRAAGG
jgi:acyl-ACP thioesterase